MADSYVSRPMHNVDDDGSNNRSDDPQPSLSPEQPTREHEEATHGGFGPPSGLGAAVGVFDFHAFNSYLEPVFVASSHPSEELGHTIAADPEPLLVLAERLAEATEAYEDQGLVVSTPLRHMADTADRLLALVETAEDGGFEGASILQSPFSEAFLAHRDRLVLLLIQGSPMVNALLGGGPVSVVAEACNLPTVAYSRAALRYWALALVDPTFKGVDLITTRPFRRWLSKVTPRSPLLTLLHGSWEHWPAFRPDEVLALGAPHDPAFEDAPPFDWVIGSIDSTNIIAHRLPLQIRRFLHLEFLRQAHPDIYDDYVLAYDAEIAEEFLDGYADLEGARPWSADYATCWAYVDGACDELPSPCLIPRLPLDEVAADVQACALLGALRDTLRVVRAARARQAGLYVVFYERAQPAASSQDQAGKAPEGDGS